MAFPGTFVSIQNIVIGKLRLTASVDRNNVKDWINQVYAEIVGECEYLQDAATMTLTTNVSAYTLPSSVFRFKNAAIRPAGTGQTYGPPLEEISIEELTQFKYYSGAPVTSLGSQYYCLLGSTRLELWPAPLGADTLRMHIVLLPTPLSGDTDIPIIPEPYGSKALEYGALAEAADFLTDGHENNYRQLAMYWKRKVMQHKNRIGGGGVWTIPVANLRSRLSPRNDIDIRYG